MKQEVRDRIKSMKEQEKIYTKQAATTAMHQTWPGAQLNTDAEMLRGVSLVENDHKLVARCWWTNHRQGNINELLHAHMQD